MDFLFFNLIIHPACKHDEIFHRKLLRPFPENFIMGFCQGKKCFQGIS